MKSQHPDARPRSYSLASLKVSTLRLAAHNAAMRVRYGLSEQALEQLVQERRAMQKPVKT
jgi:hypothetical protein